MIRFCGEEIFSLYSSRGLLFSPHNLGFCDVCGCVGPNTWNETHPRVQRATFPVKATWPCAPEGPFRRDFAQCRRQPVYTPPVRIWPAVRTAGIRSTAFSAPPGLSPSSFSVLRARPGDSAVPRIHARRSGSYLSEIASAAAPSTGRTGDYEKRGFEEWPSFRPEIGIRNKQLTTVNFSS